MTSNEEIAQHFVDSVAEIKYFTTENQSEWAAFEIVAKLLKSQARELDKLEAEVAKLRLTSNKD